MPIETPRFRMGLPRGTVHVHRLCPAHFQGAWSTEHSVSGISQGLWITAVPGSPLQRWISGTGMLGATQCPCTCPPPGRTRVAVHQAAWGSSVQGISTVGSTKRVMIIVKLNKESALRQLVSPSQQDGCEIYHVGGSTFICM